MQTDVPAEVRMTELLGLLADVLPWIEETCSDPGLLPTAPGALEELQALRDRIQRALDDRAADLTAIEPAPEVCALQKALEALEAAEVDLYPRDGARFPPYARFA